MATTSSPSHAEPVGFFSGVAHRWTRPVDSHAKGKLRVWRRAGRLR